MTSDKPPKPSTLTRDSTVATANRFAACEKDIEKKLGDRPAGWTCDEYPFASTQEGGANARAQWVPASENNRQGGKMMNFYRSQQIIDRDKFIVKAVLKR